MDMARCITVLAGSWHGNPAVSKEVLDEIERSAAVTLPADYRQFMTWSDGGERQFPSIYLSFWQAADIVDLNRDYLINHYLGDQVLAIGSDGGPICFLLDYRASNDARVCSVNFGDLDPAGIKPISASFSGMLELALAGKIDGEAL